MILRSINCEYFITEKDLKKRQLKFEIRFWNISILCKNLLCISIEPELFNLPNMRKAVLEMVQADHVPGLRLSTFSESSIMKGPTLIELIDRMSLSPWGRLLAPMRQRHSDESSVYGDSIVE